jgi:hypothetical protein
MLNHHIMLSHIFQNILYSIYKIYYKFRYSKKKYIIPQYIQDTKII